MDRQACFVVNKTATRSPFSQLFTHLLFTQRFSKIYRKEQQQLTFKIELILLTGLSRILTLRVLLIFFFQVCWNLGKENHGKLYKEKKEDIGIILLI